MTYSTIQSQMDLLHYTPARSIPVNLNNSSADGGTLLGRSSSHPTEIYNRGDLQVNADNNFNTSRESDRFLQNMQSYPPAIHYSSSTQTDNIIDFETLQKIIFKNPQLVLNILKTTPYFQNESQLNSSNLAMSFQTAEYYSSTNPLIKSKSNEFKSHENLEFSRRSSSSTCNNNNNHNINLNISNNNNRNNNNDHNPQQTYQLTSNSTILNFEQNERILNFKRNGNRHADIRNRFSAGDADRIIKKNIIKLPSTRSLGDNNN